MKLLLITGVPGMGKTTIGDYLKDKYGFDHINLEGPNGQPNRHRVTKKLILRLLQQINKETVITWGFGPHRSEHIEIIHMLTAKGGRMFWFDGNRGAAKKSFMIRDKFAVSSKKAFDRQIKRIDSLDIKNTFHPIFYNTFDENGIYKNLDDIVRDLLILTEENN